MAQVPGAISWRHENLNEGASFPANSHLATIDQHDYLVAVARAESQVLSAKANRIELLSREKDLHRSIEIETASVQIAEQDYERNLSLSKEGHISPTQLSQQKQALLRQEQSIQTLQSQLHLIPAQHSVAEARDTEANAVLSKAKEDLRRTEVKWPFAARIEKLNVELGQFVPAGQSMLIAESNLAVEILMELPFDLVGSRFPGLMAGPNQVVVGNGLKAVATHPSGLHWNGIVHRVDSGLSDVNRSVRIYIEIILEDEQSQPPSNLYLEVALIGETLKDRLVIPRTAYRQGQVLVAIPHHRLEIREATAELKDKDIVVIRSGLKAGERLILSDILRPVDSRLLQPIEALKATSL
jgi:multidrug efflux system membrane fusion protein